MFKLFDFILILSYDSNFDPLQSFLLILFQLRNILLHFSLILIHVSLIQFLNLLSITRIISHSNENLSTQIVPVLQELRLNALPFSKDITLDSMSKIHQAGDITDIDALYKLIDDYISNKLENLIRRQFFNLNKYLGNLYTTIAYEKFVEQ